MSGLALNNVCKSFDDLQVIHGVDLDINQGEFAVFVGPSGCGKSTLLRMVAGLEDISDGTISIEDKDVTHVAASKRGVAMVFQSYALYPHMTVEQNMGFSLKMAGMAKAEIAKCVGDAARTLHLEDLLRRKPKQLSGGQRQRVAIGRAIVRSPKLFLFDEPLSNLDAELRVRMRLEIARLHKRLGATMVYVTHDQVEAMTLADKIVVLRDGRIEQAGPPARLYSDPDNMFVAGFIGSPKMNFLKVKIESRTDTGIVATLSSFGDQKVSMVIADDTLRPGMELKLGIRPEHFWDAGVFSMDIPIEVVEDLGGVAYAYSAIDSDEPLIIRVGPKERRLENTVLKTSFDPAEAFLFDPGTGKRIR